MALRSPHSLLAGAAFVALAAGCHLPYEPPSLSEPHATAKLRIVYHDTPRTELDQLLLLNGRRLAVPAPVELPGQISRAVPMRLEDATVEVRTDFFHTITTYETRTERYACGSTSYSCGTSTCYNTTYCTRTVTTPVTTRISDAFCARAASLGAQKDAVYLLQFDFYADRRCTLACLREWPQPDGSFKNGPCDPPLKPVASDGDGDARSTRTRDESSGSPSFQCCD
jgi:hypothetical protein